MKTKETPIQKKTRKKFVKAAISFTSSSSFTWRPKENRASDEAYLVSLKMISNEASYSREYRTDLGRR
uniref:Uncharacterized protein n=1 Tax=Cucumis melo TaxID=3656 RepID=A0A9I9DX01_CUCME